MANSEPIDASSDDLDPELVPIVDDDAFIEYLHDFPDDPDADDAPS